VRRSCGLLLAVCLAGLIVLRTARGQDGGDLQPHYWPHRTVGIPVDLDRISKLPNKPVALQLYYTINRSSTFLKAARLPLDGMQQLDGGKRGFLFQAERDGDFEFTVQFIYADNTVSPLTDQLSPQVRTIVDTTPPVIRIYPSNTGVSWETFDDNLDPSGMVLECKWPTQREWTRVTDRPFRATDNYAWRLPPGKVLEVRVTARDRAGNEGVSPVVRVPPDPFTGTGQSRVFGNDGYLPNAGLPAPRIDYVNTLDFDVEYSIQKMGRSGVRAAHLFVLKNQSSPAEWEFVKKFDVNLMPGDKEQTISIPYSAREEGIYGFYVIPESGAGKRAEDPQRHDQPMINVVVDKTPPYVRITNVQVKPGGTRGPLVEISWEAADPNLMPDPISLEWSVDWKATRWNEVKYRLRNNPNSQVGRYVWEVPDENLWKFYLRIRAVDKASNTGEHIWGQDLPEKRNPPTEVIVDLEKPTGTINKVRGNNSPRNPGGAGVGSDSPLPKPPMNPSGPTPPSSTPPSVPPLPAGPQFPSGPKLPTLPD